jgi:HD-like signal output (HDOD) protein
MASEEREMLRKHDQGVDMSSKNQRSGEAPSIQPAVPAADDLDTEIRKRGIQNMKRIREGMEAGESACLPELIRIINTLSMNVQDLPVFQLTDLVQNDPIILKKIISAANKIGYNPLNIPINSLFQAIQVIGFDRIRSLTMAMILLENSQGGAFNPARREAALLALTAGLVTQKISQCCKFNVDRDTAFVCGAMRGYGLILMATYLPENLEQARQLEAGGIPREKAYKRAFGYAPIELTEIIMRDAEMPDTIVDSMVPYRPGTPDNRTKSGTPVIAGLAEFSYRLSEEALDPVIDAESFGKSTEKLRGIYSKIIDSDADFNAALLGSVHEYINTLRQNTVSNAFSSDGFACLKARSLQQDPPKRQKDTDSESASHLLNTGSGTGWETRESSTATEKIGVHDSDSFWQEGLEQLAQFENEAGLSPKALDALFQLLKEGFNSNETWLFVDPMGGNHFKLLHGSGSYPWILGKKTHVSIRERSIFGLCLQRQEIMVITDARHPKMRPHIPAWYRDKVNMNSFVLCSVHDQGKPLGLIYIGWPESKNFEIQHDKVPLIRAIGAQVSKWIKS